MEYELFEDFEEHETWNDEEPARGRREELHEGGDYHLQSALRSFKDYRRDFIFRKEEEKLDKVLHQDAVEVSSIYVLDLFWSLASRNQQINKLYIINDLARFGMTGDISSDVGKFVSAELSVLYGFGANDSQIFKDSINEITRRFTAKHPCMKWVINLMCLILVLKNNLKNIRAQNINGFTGMEHVWMEDDVCVVRVEGSFFIRFTTDVFAVEHKNTIVKFPTNYFLQASDKVQERFNVLLYASLVSPTIRFISVTPETLEEMIAVGDEILALHGNEGYDAIGNYEAIVVGCILERDDPDLITDTGSFLRSVIDGVDEEFHDSVGKWVAILRTLSVDQLADIHGIYRIWGHPIIDIEAGIEKMMSISLKEKLTDEIRGEETRRKFREIFFINYRSQNGFYPPYEHFEENDHPTYLEKALAENRIIKKDHATYRLSDWDNILPIKCFEIPYSWNILHTVKDKAISPNREELYLNLVTRGHVFNMNYRRVVLKTVATPMVPMRRFLHDIAENMLKDKYSIIGIYAKERELKIKPRFFSLMSHELRLYTTSTEELLNDKVLKYFPQITMSLNLLEMQKKMGRMAQNLAEQSTSVTYVVNMDFIKWNQQMRYDICKPVFQELDKLFGAPGLYDNTHKIFSQCIVYLSSGERPLIPDKFWGVFPDMKYAWNNDGSGKEGLRQKGWTIMTDCDILYVADKEGADVMLVGGGDNQVLTVTFRSRDTDEKNNITEEGKEKIKNKMESFMRALQDHFDNRGLPLKSSETWISSNLFMYNKHMYYKGRSMRAVLKQISRCFPFANSSIMSASLMCNSVSTILKAAMQKELFAMGVLCMKTIWGIEISRYATMLNPLFLTVEGSLQGGKFPVIRGRERHMVNVGRQDFEYLWIKFLCLPSCLGGPGMSNCFNLTMRGFPDTLTEGIMYMNQMYEKLSLVDMKWSVVLYNMLGVSFSILPKFEKLVEDPTAISHDCPSHSTAKMREGAREAVSNMAQGVNKEFVELMAVADKDRENQFYTALCSGDELDPRVYHEIAKASLYGFTNSLISRIDKTKTVLRLNETITIVTEIAKSEHQYIGYLAARDKLPHDFRFEPCSRRTAEKLRTISFGKRVLGVTVPHPAEYLRVSPKDQHICLDGHIDIRYDGVGWTNASCTSGPCKPYYGSYTKERFKATEIASAYGDEDLLRRVVSIQKMIGWRYSAESMFGRLIKGAFQAVTNTDPEMLWVDENMIRGSYDHRRNVDNNTHGGIPNFLITPSTHLSMCTSSWVEHSRSGTNETIHFQACMITCVIKMVGYMMTKEPDNKISEYHAHDCCRTCITPLDDINPQKTAPKVTVDFPTCVNNSLVYMNHEDVKLDYSRLKKIEDMAELGQCRSVTTQELLVVWGKYNVAVDCVSTILFLDIIGLKSGVSKSFLLLARDKTDVRAVLNETRTKCTAWQNLVGSPLMTRSTTSVDVYCDTLEGYMWKQQVMGWTTDGNIEGATETRNPDYPEGSTQLWFGSTINPVLGNIGVQAILYLLGQYPILQQCSECSGILLSCVGKRFKDIKSLRLCDRHALLSVDFPVVPIHPDNVIKTAGAHPSVLSQEVIIPENVPPLFMYTQICPGGTEDKVPLDILARMAERVDISPWSITLAGGIEHLGMKDIMVYGDIFSLNIILDTARKINLRDRITLWIMISSLTYNETGNVQEKLLSGVPMAMPQMKVVYNMGEVPIGTLIVHVEGEKKLSVHDRQPYRWLVGASDVWDMDRYEYAMINSLHISTCGRSPAVATIVTYGKNSAIVDYGMINSVVLEGGSCFSLWPNNEQREPLAFSGRSGSRRYIAAYKFFSRLELIQVNDRVLQRVRRLELFTKKKRRNTMIQRILGYFIVSILSHGVEDCLDRIERIRSIIYHPLSGSITIKLKTSRTPNDLGNFYCEMKMFLRRSGREWMEVAVDDVFVGGVHTAGQKRRGFNVYGV